VRGPLALSADSSATFAGPRWLGVWDRAQLALMAAFAATSILSVFAAQAFLCLATIVWIVRIAARRTRFERIAIDAPILAFIVWTLLSASFSPDPAESFRTGGKKLVLFVLIYVALDTLRGERQRERIFDAVLLGALVLGIGTIAQYYFLGYDTLDRRPTSFLGHWMTAAGLSMGALVLAVARLVFRREPFPRPSRDTLVRLAILGAALGGFVILERLDLFAVEAERLIVFGVALTAALIAVGRGSWTNAGMGAAITLLAVPVCAWALVLSQTRSAWLGALAGLGLVAILRAPRLLWLLGAAVAVLLIVRPQPVVKRLTISDVSSVDRYYMWQAGVDMIRDKPVFGQGPGIIPFAYQRFRWADAPSASISHLHNNAVHLAAERGIPCVAFWLWWLALSLGRAYREARQGAWDARWIAVGSLGFLTAVLVAGLFEYNFGDSEVLYVILLTSVAPFVLGTRQAAEARAA
jgi:O-antigen ligase